MKKMNCFRATVTIALFLVTGMGSFAQYVGPTATYDASKQLLIM